MMEAKTTLEQIHNRQLSEILNDKTKWVRVDDIIQDMREEISKTGSIVLAAYVQKLRDLSQSNRGDE